MKKFLSLVIAICAVAVASAQIKVLKPAGVYKIPDTPASEYKRLSDKYMEGALNSPLLKNRNVMTSKKLLFNIYFSSKAENKYSMHETAEITSFVSNINE